MLTGSTSRGVVVFFGTREGELPAAIAGSVPGQGGRFRPCPVSSGTSPFTGPTRHGRPRPRWCQVVTHEKQHAVRGPRRCRPAPGQGTEGVHRPRGRVHPGAAAGGRTGGLRGGPRLG